MVRVKLKYALPLVQMVLAVGLLVSDHFWLRTAMRRADMPGQSPAFTLLVSINAPVALARAFVFRRLPDQWDKVTFTAAIGLLWYWVALNLDSWRKRRTVSMFSWVPLRLVCDFVLLGVGVFWGGVWVRTLPHYLPVSWFGWLSLVLRMGLEPAWSLVLIFFVGRDFIHCILRKKPEAA